MKSHPYDYNITVSNHWAPTVVLWRYVTLSNPHKIKFHKPIKNELKIPKKIGFKKQICQKLTKNPKKKLVLRNKYVKNKLPSSKGETPLTPIF